MQDAHGLLLLCYMQHLESTSVDSVCVQLYRLPKAGHTAVSPTTVAVRRTLLSLLQDHLFVSI